MKSGRTILSDLMFSFLFFHSFWNNSAIQVLLVSGSLLNSFFLLLLLNSNFIIQQFVLKCFSFVFCPSVSVLFLWSTQYRYSFFSVVGFHSLDFNAQVTTWTSLAHWTFSSRSGTRVPKFMLETNQLWICSWGHFFFTETHFFIYKMDNIIYLIVFILKIQ